MLLLVLHFSFAFLFYKSAIFQGYSFLAFLMPYTKKMCRNLI